MVSKLGVALGIVGVLLGAGAELGSFFLKRAVNDRVTEALVVDSKEHPDYPDWETADPDASPTLLSFRFLNLTNAAEFLSGAQDPIVQEIGPYTFRKWQDKIDVSFSEASDDDSDSNDSDDNDDGDDDDDGAGKKRSSGKAGAEVTFKSYTRYTFVPEESVAGADPERDFAVIPNPTFPGLLAQAGGSEAALLGAALSLSLGSIGELFATDFVLGARVAAFPQTVSGLLDALTAQVGGNRDAALITWATNADAIAAVPAFAGFAIGTLTGDDAAPDGALAALFDTQNTAGSFATDEGLAAWLAVAGGGGDPAALAAANAGLPAGAVAKVAAWVAQYLASDALEGHAVAGFQGKAQAAGVDASQVASLSDLAFFQVATGRGIEPAVVVSAEKRPGYPAPEIGVFCQQAADPAASCPGGFRPSVDSTRRLVTGNFSLGVPANLARFSAEAAVLANPAGSSPQAQQAAAVYIASSYAVPQASLPQFLATVGAWIGHVRTAFVLAPYTALTAVAGGAGPIARRSIREWLLRYEDPVLKIFFPDEPRRWNRAFLTNHSSAAEASEFSRADTMYTGAGDLADRRVYTRYNGESYVGELTGLGWDHKEVITGTDATSFEPETPKGDGVELDAFVSFVYRVAKVAYQGTSDVKGLTTFSFDVPPKVLAVDPKFDQFYRGVLNLTRVTGSPLIVTKPHFLDADTDFLGSIEGMSAPDDSVHGFVIEVEPITGVVIKGNKRLQYNIAMGPTDSYFPAIPKRIVPLFWVDERGEISDDDADTLKKITTALWVSFVLFIGGFAAGGFFLILGVAICIFKRDAGDRPAHKGMEKMVEL